MGGQDILILVAAWLTILAILTVRLGRARRKLLDESERYGADGVSLTAADIPTVHSTDIVEGAQQDHA